MQNNLLLHNSEMDVTSRLVRGYFYTAGRTETNPCMLNLTFSFPAKNKLANPDISSNNWIIYINMSICSTLEQMHAYIKCDSFYLFGKLQSWTTHLHKMSLQWCSVAHFHCSVQTNIDLHASTAASMQN